MTKYNKSYNDWVYKKVGQIGSSLIRYTESIKQEREELKTLRTNMIKHNWSLEKIMEFENDLPNKIAFLWPSEQKEFEKQVIPKLKELIKLKLIEKVNAIDIRYSSKSDLVKLTNFRDKHHKEYKILGYTFPKEIYQVLDQKSNEVYDKLILNDLRKYNNIKYTGNLKDLETINIAYKKFREYWIDINPSFKPLGVTLNEMQKRRIKLRDQFMPLIESEIKNSISSAYIEKIIHSTYIGTGMSDENYQKILKLQADQEAYIEELRMQAIIENDNKNKALTNSGYGYIPLSFWDKFEQGEVLYDVFYGHFGTSGMSKSEESLLIFFYKYDC